jgi:tetratricopeptide (TPR) repeat protein
MEGVMYTALLAFLLLPQLVDSTDKVNTPSPESQELSNEKRADIYMARKMYREAVESYREAIDEQPRSARLYNKLGISFHHQMMFGLAKQHYERASELDQKFSQAINNLGAVYYAEGRYKKAQRAYEKALKITPESASVYSNLGTAFFARNKFEKATEAYLTALQLDPNVFETKGTTGTLLQERSVADRMKYHYFMAEAYAKSEMYEQALIYLRRAFEEGFSDRRKVLSEKAFEPLHGVAAFRMLVDPEGKLLAEQQASN